MPKYPAELREQGVEGQVTLTVAVDRSGKVVWADFARGEPKLAQVSSDVVKQWKFKPLLLNAQPTGMTGAVTLAYDAQTGRVSITSAPEKLSNSNTR